MGAIHRARVGVGQGPDWVQGSYKGGVQPAGWDTVFDGLEHAVHWVLTPWVGACDTHVCCFTPDLSVKGLMGYPRWLGYR